MPASGDFLIPHVKNDTISDPEVQIRLVPGDPENAILVGGSTHDRALFPIGIGGFIAGGAVLGFMLTRRPKLPPVAE